MKSEGDENAPGRAQCEMEHTGGCASGPDDEGELISPMEPRDCVQGGETAEDWRTPGKPHEPSNALYDAVRVPIHVHVNQGGSTPTERNGSVAWKRRRGCLWRGRKG